MFKLEEIIFSVTSRCNLKCIMCDIPFAAGEELRTQALVGALRDAASLGARTAVFSGGEPLLRDDIFDLIKSAKGLGLSACLTSNGCILDEPTAEKLAAAGVDVVNISVEGDMDTHERLRGKGTYAKAVAALRSLRRVGVETTIASTVSKYNYGSLGKVVELAKDSGATTLKFQPFSKIFIQPGKDCAEFLLSSEEAAVLLKELRGIHARCSQYGISVNPLSYLESIPGYLSGKHSAGTSSCRALFSSCPVDSRGRIYPCWVLSDEKMLVGDLGTEDLKEIWGARRHREIIRMINSVNCGGCLMSCYDANFSSPPAAATSRPIEVAKKSVSLSALRRLRRKISFYLAYRGSMKNILRRLVSSRRRKHRPAACDLELKMREISTARKALEKELRGGK